MSGPQSGKSTKTAAETAGSAVALGLFYAATLGHLGVVLPFFAPWLQDRGFSAAAIGGMLAVPSLAKIVAPWTWGRWADRSGRRRELLVFACLVAATAMASMAWIPAAGLVVTVVIYGFHRAPLLPFIEATSLEQAERRGVRYGPIRLWGSLAFVVLSTGYGAARDWGGADAGILLAASLLGVGAIVATRLPRPWSHPAIAADSPRPAAAPRGIVRFFVACALMQVSHGAYYTFYSIHLRDQGYGSAAIGGLWALGVICEILLFTGLDRIVDRFGSGTVLRASLLLAAVRWAVIGATDSTGWLIIAQMLHAATYAAFHLAAIRVVYRHYGTSRRAHGQAMYSGMTYGFGMFVGSLAAGGLAEWLGLSGLFVASSFIALAAIPVLGSERRTLSE